MPEHGDDAGHCRNGLTAQDNRDATPEDRALYRRWGFGMVVFYCALLLIAGAVAIVSDSGTSLTKGKTLSAQRTVVSPKIN